MNAIQRRTAGPRLRRRLEAVAVLIGIDPSTSVLAGPPPTASARRLDPDSGAFLQTDTGLAGQRFTNSIAVNDLGPSRRSVRTSIQAVGSTGAPVREQGDF